MSDPMVCRHDPCTCRVADDEFCSDHCRQAAGTGAASAITSCGCGHAECDVVDGVG